MVKKYSRPDGTEYLAGICPWHGDNRPSLLVWEDDRFRCLACGREGNHITLLNELTQPGSQAVLTVRPKAKLPVLRSDSLFVNSAHALLVNHTSLQVYLEQRGLVERIIPNRLGWYEGWYIVPIFDAVKNLIGTVGRAGPTAQKLTGQRFLVPFGQSPLLFCPDWKLFGQSDTIIVVYGLFDALALADLRIACCTTTSGKDSFNPEWVSQYRSKRFVVVPDLGEEEEARKLSRQIGLRASSVRLEYPEGFKDPADFLQNGKRVELGNLLRRIA